MFFLRSKPNLPPRLPAGLPANFKGVPTGGDQLTSHIQGAGNVPFDPLSAGVGSMRMDVLKSIAKGFWGHWYFRFDSYDPPEKANKFTLRGAINFDGDYPKDLVVDGKK